MVVGKRVVKFTMVGTDIALRQLPLPLPLPEKFYHCHTCKDTGRVQVFDQCEHCDGIGCSKCDEGLVPSSIPCPMCESRKRFQQAYR